MKFGKNHANYKGRVCKVDGCNGKHQGKGYCNTHYQRVLRHGSTNRAERKYGQDHPNAKGGGINSGGYKVFYYKRKRYLEHRYYMEECLDRRLESDEHVHHINGDTSDNRFENLQLLTQVEHSRIHMTNNHKNGIMPKPKKLGKYRPCSVCGSKTYLPPSRIRDKKDIGRFCSKSCHGIYVSNNNLRNKKGQFVSL